MKPYCVLQVFLRAAVLSTFVVSIARGAAEGRATSTLKVSGNGRYFVDQNGKPFFWQGDTEWELFHLFTPQDAQTMLERRRDQGFNVVQVMATGLYFAEWEATKGLKPWNAAPAWLGDNPLTPNEDYFKRVDEIVAMAARHHMVLVIGVYHAADQEKGRITLQNAGPWARWLAQRYKHASNIVWSMYPHAAPESEAVVQAAVKGLLDGDGGAHLITMHPDPSPTSSSFMHTERWLSFNTLQTWSPGFVNYDMVAADYNRTPTKPVVDGEARYEQEDGTTPLQCRRAGYLACLAGGFYSFGHGGNWMSPPTWRTWWDTPGASQMKVLGDVFRSIEWWKLVPDRTIITGGNEGDVAARS